jgi:hypothetical protein
MVNHSTADGVVGMHKEQSVVNNLQTFHRGIRVAFGQEDGKTVVGVCKCVLNRLRKE